MCVLMLQSECFLVQCREQIMEEEVAVTVFDTDKYSSAVKQGQMSDHYVLPSTTSLAFLCVFTVMLI